MKYVGFKFIQSAAPPANPEEGWIWFDETDGTPKMWNGSEWRALGGASPDSVGLIVHGSVAATPRGTDYSHYMWIGSVEPINKEEFDIWIDI